ncbi:MAG: hypothetical protein IPO94_06740, partial [Saprospiraceae bacterium]|nr:hypothetical protein [Saprospiraceae bacterium]
MYLLQSKMVIDCAVHGWCIPTHGLSRNQNVPNDHSDLEMAAKAMTNMILERGAKDNFSIGILDVVKVQFAEPMLKVPPLTHQQNQSKNTNHWFKWWFALP